MWYRSGFDGNDGSRARCMDWNTHGTLSFGNHLPSEHLITNTDNRTSRSPDMLSERQYQLSGHRSVNDITRAR